jgi:hypothetical protein
VGPWFEAVDGKLLAVHVGGSNQFVSYKVVPLRSQADMCRTYHEGAIALQSQGIVRQCNGTVGMLRHISA